VARALRQGIPILLISGSPGRVAQSGRLYRSLDPGDYLEVTENHEQDSLESRILRQVQAELARTGDQAALANLEVQGTIGREVFTFDAQGAVRFERRPGAEVSPQEQITLGKALAVAYLRLLGRQMDVALGDALAAIEASGNFVEIRDRFRRAVEGRTSAFFPIFGHEVNLSAYDTVVDGREVLALAQDLLAEQGYALDARRFQPSASGDYAKFSLARKQDGVRGWAQRHPGEGALLMRGDSATDDFLTDPEDLGLRFPVFLGAFEDMAGHPGVIVARDRRGRDRAGYRQAGAILKNFLDAHARGLTYDRLAFVDGRRTLAQIGRFGRRPIFIPGLLLLLAGVGVDLS
jgi:hypothetical protein